VSLHACSRHEIPGVCTGAEWFRSSFFLQQSASMWIVRVMHHKCYLDQTVQPVDANARNRRCSAAELKLAWSLGKDSKVWFGHSRIDHSYSRSIKDFDIASEWCRSLPSAPSLCLIAVIISSTSADRTGLPNHLFRSLSKRQRPRKVSPSLFNGQDSEWSTAIRLEFRKHSQLVILCN